MSVDIVNLIESNPITKLSGDYHSKLVEKVKNNFTNYEQQLFLSSFYCYLKYDPKNDFVIDLDNVWKWLDFSSKHKAKELLNRTFTVNKDYKLLLTQLAKQTTNSKGGHNKETFMLSVNTYHHSLIYSSKVTNLKDHKKENELFLIGITLTYQTLLKIINDNIDNYNYKVRELLLEIENLKLKNNGQSIN